MSEIEKNSILHDHQIKSRRLTFKTSIVFNASPALIKYSTDLPSVAVVRAEGQVAEADAIENLSAEFTTADAGTGVFGLLLKKEALGELDQVYQVRVVSALGTTVVTPASSSYITPEGNLAIDINSDQNHETTSETIILEISYKIKTI